MPREELEAMCKTAVTLLGKEKFNNDNLVKQVDTLTQSFKWTSFQYWKMKGVETEEAREELWNGVMKTLNQ